MQCKSWSVQGPRRSRDTDAGFTRGMWLIPFIAVAGLLAAALAGCGQPHAQGGEGMSMPPPAVSVVTVTPLRVPIDFQYVGQTQGTREVEIRARVTGILQKRNYAEGARVTAGQSLFTIDPAPFEATLARVDGEVAAAEARYVQASRNAARLRSLLDTRAISQLDYDNAAAAELIASADLKSAKARLAEAKLNLGYTQVTSPVTGIASRALKSDGSLVSGPDVLLTTVTRIDPMYVLFGVADNERLHIRREMEAGRLQLPKGERFQVHVTLADGTEYAQSGTLGFSDVRIAQTTGTSEARAELPNAGEVLRPGQFVRVRLSGATIPAALQVPQRAVLEGPQGKFVYVLSADDKAEARPVELGDWNRNGKREDWIVTKGLAAGERVVVDGVMKIGPGAPVQVTMIDGEPVKPAAPAAPTAERPAQTAARAREPGASR
jgi:membrane fusion protein, multidrug efflux system